MKTYTSQELDFLKEFTSLLHKHQINVVKEYDPTQPETGFQVNFEVLKFKGPQIDLIISTLSKFNPIC